MLDVDDILLSPLTPSVLPPHVPEPVCEIQRPALFAMTQTFPRQKSVDLAIYARVNLLPSPATSSSSSGEYCTCIMRATQAYQQPQLDHWVCHKNSCSKDNSGCQSHHSPLLWRHSGHSRCHSQHHLFNRWHNRQHRCPRQHPHPREALFGMTRLPLNNQVDQNPKQ